MCSLDEIRGDKNEKESTALASVEESGSPPACVLANDVSEEDGQSRAKRKQVETKTGRLRSRLTQPAPVYEHAPDSDGENEAG